MKLSEQIREYIQNHGHDFLNPNRVALLESGALLHVNAQEILYAIEAMEEGRVLPIFPNGYTCQSLSNIGGFEWRCILKHYMGERQIATGPTPSAAVQAAIDKIIK